MNVCLTAIVVVTMTFSNCNEATGYPDRKVILEQTIRDLPAGVVKHGPISTRNEGQYFIWTKDKSYPPITVARQKLQGGEVIEMLLYENGELHGIQRKWHVNGQIKEESQYQFGKMDGVTRRWDTKGRLVARFKMERGSGIEREYFETGMLKLESSFKDGTRDGLRIDMHENGRVAGIMTYREGNPVGIAIGLHPNGSLRLVVNYDSDGRTHGPCVQFASDHSVIEHQLFVNGQAVDEATYRQRAAMDATLPAFAKLPAAYSKLYSEKYEGLVEHYETLEPIDMKVLATCGDQDT